MTKEKLPTIASSGATYESEKRLVSSYLRAARYEDIEVAFRKAEMPDAVAAAPLDAAYRKYVRFFFPK